MTLLQTIFLGILQGATEFLPVSSSGHLFLAQKLLGLHEPELAFDTLLHLGTLFAVVAFLRAEISGMIGSLFRRERYFKPPDAWGRREIGLLILSTIPTGIIGLAFRDVVEKDLTLWGLGVRYLILTGLLLISNLRFRHKFDPDRIVPWEAIAIGIIQGLAVFPGLSRSGSTITLALVLGIGASRSAKYSFLISVPAILGAALVNLHKGFSVLPSLLPSAAGFLGALVTGYLALFFVDRLVTRGRFFRFAPYTFLVALLCFYVRWKGLAP
ncbi:MAG: undecaprenyl-diphosphate phosphatase [Deltaproteobacteria bacterium]|nr:undecaprenyl-diphosphate phosphatase [Deltaproteobacteria bacterium]